MLLCCAAARLGNFVGDAPPESVGLVTAAPLSMGVVSSDGSALLGIAGREFMEPVVAVVASEPVGLIEAAAF